MHWRYTMQSPRFLMIDYRGLFPFIIMFLHISWPTFYFATAMTFLLWFIERHGMSVPAAVRWIRMWFATLPSDRRPALPDYLNRRSIDYDRCR